MNSIWVGVGRAFVVLAASTSLAHAQETTQNPSLSKAWTFEAGAVFQSLDGNLSAVTSGGTGGSYDLSRLGLDNQDTSFTANLRWRLSDRWRLDLGYDQIDTNGTLANGADFDFGPVTIPAGYEIISSLETRAYSAFLGYGFSKGHDFELGGRLGLTVFDADASVGGRAFIGGSEVVAGPGTISMTTLVPTLGLYGMYAFNDRLAFEGAIDGIAGTVGSYSGHYLQLNAGLKYWFTDAIALSAGYRFLDAESDRDGSYVDNGVDIRSQGVYVKSVLGF